MASFKNDIFISYAHADNKSGWVDAFHTSLQTRLEVLGVSARIWRDRKLGGADVFSDEILDQLRQSGLLISVLSPNGMRSNWCEKERRKFEQFANASIGFRLANVVRALKVVVTPADQDAHRLVFGTIGYEFFERNAQTGRYDHYFPSDTRFETQIDLLAQEIKDILQRLSTFATKPVKPAVYVAEVSPDLEPDRVKVVDQILAWGYPISPVEPLSSYTSVRPAIEAALSEAILSVHLLSDKRGPIPGEEDSSILAIQYELAAARGIDRVVWVLPNLRPHPNVEGAIAAGAAQGLERLEGQNTIEDLKEVLAAKLNRFDEQVREASRRVPRLNIYLVCDRTDHPFSSEVQNPGGVLNLKLFLDSRGYCVWLPPVNVANPRERDRDHRETLKLSDAVILYWGAADEAWFRGTLRELTKARSTTRRNRPFSAEALYLGEPARQEKGQYRTHLDLIVEQFNGFQGDALRPFLDRLGRTKDVTPP